MSEPVWDGYFADPDVIRADSGYFAYGTDGPGQPTLAHFGRVFPVLRSSDFASWELVGGALEPPPLQAGQHFWAPEVAEHEGRSYMYYSAGGEGGQHHP